MAFSGHETNFDGSYEFCELCPRACGVDRTQGVPGKGPGFCGETDQLRVAHVGPHFGEEPPITGTRGSGTVFLFRMQPEMQLLSKSPDFQWWHG